MTEDEKVSEETRDAGEDSSAQGDEGRGDEARDDAGGRRRSMGEGIKEGLGVLSAFRDALEETIQEARERGDLSADRARSVMKETLEKAQTAAEGARVKLDFATQVDLERLRDTVEAMKGRLDDLEESVFGASRAPTEEPEPEPTPKAEKPEES